METCKRPVFPRDVHQRVAALSLYLSFQDAFVRHFSETQLHSTGVSLYESYNSSIVVASTPMQMKT